MVWRVRSSQREPMAMSAPAGDGGEEAVGFLDGRGKIGVGEHDHFSEGVEDAVADAVALCRGCRDSGAGGLRGGFWAKARTISAVWSREPSSTTTTSAFQPR